MAKAKTSQKGKGTGKITLLASLIVVSLAHDFYIYYNKSMLNTKIEFYFADIGYVWFEHFPSSHEAFKDTIISSYGSDVWNNYMELLLGMPISAIATIPLAVYLVFKFIGVILSPFVKFFRYLTGKSSVQD